MCQGRFRSASSSNGDESATSRTATANANPWKPDVKQAEPQKPKKNF